MDIGNFFGNPSAAAFVGAFAAFVLVGANDWRRRRRKKRMLKYLVDDNAALARDKRYTIQMNIEMINDNRFTDAPIMRFQTVALTNNHHEVMDLMDGNENQALSTLIYWMESIDGLLDDARQTAGALRQLEELGAPNEQRTMVGKRLLRQVQDADVNLGLFDELCDYYVSGKPHKIQEFLHPISESGDRNSQ